MFNMFSGGALERFSVFFLASYIFQRQLSQLLTVVVPQLEALSKEEMLVVKSINTRYGTMLLAVVQGYMIANTLEGSDFRGVPLVADGGLG